MSAVGVRKFARGETETHDNAVMYRMLEKVHGAPFGVGTVDFEPGELAHTLTYDEALYCLQGSLLISVDDEDYTLGEGDLLWLPSGVSLVYRVATPCTLLYVTYPASPLD